MTSADVSVNIAVDTSDAARKLLDTRFTLAIRQHWRALVDTGGVPPRGLLNDLAAIASAHAGLITPDGRPARPDGTPVPEPPAASEARAARARGERAPAAPQRTTTRTRKPR